MSWLTEWKAISAQIQGLLEAANFYIGSAPTTTEGAVQVGRCGGRVSTTTEKDWFATRPWIDREDADIESYLRSQDRLADVELRRQLETWRRDGSYLGFM
jgi:hypothetical protein